MARDDVSEMIRGVQPPLTYASVCSGIEAASAAWEPLGWRCLWLAEIDKAASAVLAHQFPNVPNLGDLVTLPGRMLAGEMEPPDVLVGGTPCQSFSKAGLRGGMSDARGALTLAFVRLADAIDERCRQLGLSPCTILWENVRGVLTHKENPFGCFLGALAGEDMPLVPSGKKWTHAGLVSGPQRTIAWRLFDAQYFGLAQRRERVFVVASADFRTDPGAILFECEGVRRDSPPCREAREGASAPIAPSLTGSGRGVARADRPRGQDPMVAVPQWWDGRDIAQTLDAVLHKGQTMPETDRFPAVLQPISFDTTQITSPHNYSRPHPPAVAFDARQQDVIQYGDRAGPLDTDGYSQAICFSSKDYGGDAMVDCAPTLRASGHTESHANAGAPPAVCVTEPVTHALKADGFDGSEDGTGRGLPITVFDSKETILRVGYVVSPPVMTNGDDGKSGGRLDRQTAMRVRRLMPVECERLQGFQDYWTLVVARNGRPIVQADGPRYKQLGNSMPVPVIHWLGVRIQRELRPA